MDIKILDAILQGWKLFPARWGVQEGKPKASHIPYIKWREGSSSDPAIIESWLAKWPSCHLCVNLTASDLTVLDVDNKHGKRGSESLSKFAEKYGDIGSTLVVGTPSGGYHYYFSGAVKNSGDILGSGLDTPVMVPLAGQIVNGKGTYEILIDAPVSETPKWIRDTLGAPREKKEIKALDVQLNQPHNVAKATALALDAGPIVAGEQSNKLYQLACDIRDLAIDETCCASIILQANPRICTPVVSERDIVSIVRNAFLYARDSQGNAVPEADFVVPYEEEPAEEIKPQGVYRLSDFRGPAEPRTWIVPDWLPEGELVALYGPPGSGKSLVALQLSLAVASGSKWLGLETKTLPVLLVACEDCADELHRRIEAVRNDPACAFIFDEGNKIFDLWYGWPRVGFDNILARSDASSNKLVSGDFWKELQAQVKAMPDGPKLIVLDTIADIYAGNENDRPAVNAFLKTVLGKLRLENDATVIIVGHPAKSSDSQYSGSTAWDGGVRSRWYMSRYDNDRPGLESYRILSRAKANYAGINGDDARIVLQWMNGSFVPCREAEIVDNTLEYECRAVYDIIAEEAETGIRLNTHASAQKCIYNWPPLKDTYGKRMNRKMIDDCLAKLMSDGMIEKTKGPKSSGFVPTYVGDMDPEKHYRRIDKSIAGDNENNRDE